MFDYVSAYICITAIQQKITEGIELPNQKRIRTLGEKENYKYVGIFEADNIKQVEMKEKKNHRRVSQTNENASRNQTLLQKSYQKDKHLNCPPPVIYSWSFLKNTKEEMK